MTSGTDCLCSTSQMGWTMAHTFSRSFSLSFSLPSFLYFFLSVSFYLLLPLLSTHSPPSLGDRLKVPGRLALGLHTRVTLQGSLMEKLALFHSFSASRQPATLTSPSPPPPFLGPGNTHLLPISFPHRRAGPHHITDINCHKRQRLIKAFCRLSLQGYCWVTRDFRLLRGSYTIRWQNQHYCVCVCVLSECGYVFTHAMIRNVKTHRNHSSPL